MTVETPETVNPVLDFEWRYWVDPVADDPEPPAEAAVVYDYAAEVLADNPLAYYRHGEAAGTTLVDASGNARHGSYLNGPVLGAAGLLTADANTAATYDGVNDRAVVPYAAWMQGPFNAFTVEAWVKPSAIDSGTDLLVDRTNLGGLADGNYQFYLKRITGSTYGVLMRIGGVQRDLTTAPAGLAAVGQRAHVVGVYDGAALRLYVNGVQVASLAATGTLANGGTLPLTIASSQSANAFPGVVDEVAVYGTALSAERILAHYQIGTTGTTTPSLPVLVDYGATGWSYRQVVNTDATDYSTTAAGWTAEGEAPFGANRAGIVTPWAPESRLWIRRTLPPLAELSVTVRVEDGADVYVNGHLIGSTGIAGASASHLNPITYAADPAYLNDDADNVVAIKADDEYGGAGAGSSSDQTFLDVQLTGAIAAVPVEGGWVRHIGRTDALVSWTVTGYGRSDSNSRTTPVQATVTLAAEVAGTMCPQVGERFRLQLSDERALELGITDGAVRFTGEVTDAVIDPRGRGFYRITGVGRLGRASRRTTDTRWPRELDGARAARILEVAGVDVGTVDVGTVTLLAVTERATVAQLADAVTDSTGGSFVEQLTGVVDWHDADHRRGTVAALTLTAAEVLNDLEWSQHVGDVLNELEVTYGNPAGRVSVTDPDSIDQLDPFPGNLNTLLTDASDAHSIASLIIARRRLPTWQLPALQVDLRRTVDDPKLAGLLELRHGDRILVAGLPAGGPYAGDVEFFVEGTAEAAAKREWRFAIAVSDPALSGVSPRWTDAPPALTWDTADPALTWFDVALLENPADL